MPDQTALEMVMSMGFTQEQATKALKATNNDLERAGDWIFSHQAELDAPETERNTAPAKESFRDGSSRESIKPSISIKLHIVVAMIRKKIFGLL